MNRAGIDVMKVMIHNQPVIIAIPRTSMLAPSLLGRRSRNPYRMRQGPKHRSS
jgi:hypothetical protein